LALEISQLCRIAPFRNGLHAETLETLPGACADEGYPVKIWVITPMPNPSAKPSLSISSPCTGVCAKDAHSNCNSSIVSTAPKGMAPHPVPGIPVRRNLFDLALQKMLTKKAMIPMRCPNKPYFL
jgi:hypothetical protein